MAKARSIAACCAAVIACLCSPAVRAEPIVPNAPDTVKYSFLRGSKWYVPAPTLPAVEMHLANGAVSELSCANMLGSVTPDGRVHITFVAQGQKTMIGAVRGTGTPIQRPGGWLFEMQMSTGTTSVVAHWSYMAQCRAGQACEAKLPGSNLSLAQFLAQCP